MDEPKPVISGGRRELSRVDGDRCEVGFWAREIYIHNRILSKAPAAVPVADRRPWSFLNNIEEILRLAGRVRVRSEDQSSVSEGAEQPAVPAAVLGAFDVVSAWPGAQKPDEVGS